MTIGIYAHPDSDYQDYIQLIGTLYSNTLNLKYIDSISYSNYEDSPRITMLLKTDFHSRYSKEIKSSSQKHLTPYNNVYDHDRTRCA